jgi:hypothetical protein
MRLILEVTAASLLTLIVILLLCAIIVRYV